MPDESREPEQQDENPDAPGREAEEAAGSDSEHQDENPDAPASDQGRMTGRPSDSLEAEEAAGSDSGAADAEAQEAAPEEATAEEPQAEAEEQSEAEPDEQSAETPDAPEREAEEAGSDSPKAKDVPPGAELEPIAIEPQRELSAEERARLEAEEEERARAEAEATADAGEEPGPAREAVVDLDASTRVQATGKRKTSIARVVLRAGSGEFQINRRTLENYFPRHQHQTFVRQPLLTSGYEGKVDVRVRVHGGGIAGQAGAVRHGIARALTEIDPELRGELKRRGLLTRDARAKERRKAGLKKARKRPQFSKR
jgi:small subunit ribosomal protein S9